VTGTQPLHPPGETSLLTCEGSGNGIAAGNRPERRWGHPKGSGI